MIEGKVGSKKLVWLSNPRSRDGDAVVEINGRKETVRWHRDDQGIWIETSQGYKGYDVRKTMSDDGQPQYALLQRKNAGVTAGLNFLKSGEEGDSSTSKVKKSAKIKSQMPGKILRVFVKAGDVVKKGQAIIVMEAMKMENEIKSPQDGTIKEVKITEGQNVETGAELVMFL